MSAFILMGVSGAGKSTVGERVAAELALPFIEGDEYHPPQNVAKMSAGIPLSDAERMPWIDALAGAVNGRLEPDVLVACSALSNAVRARLRSRLARPVYFVFLTAPPEVIEARLAQRPRHFMKAGMLGSQFKALQVPQDAVAIDVNRPLEDTTAEVRTYVRGHLTRRS
ncbi:MAG: gluconokinase [Steroidobacteraceae bacterium]